ncbi:hypothetical protein HII36_37395 [Nonomuraea sp. NN258]|uniref:trypsin-like serine peptidase n=1 Tax=Nonomuraea antri TaxID=2730852 RepID=UPI00156A482D|nr:hypothetical protein [Nonomuraea antri]NRQ37470.1 hypothetical protein [Nonomuraea antri]
MIPRARHLVAAALSSALLMLPAFTGISNALAETATSTATSAAAAPSHVYTVPLAKTVDDVKKVAEYWRPEKLKKADSYSPATPGSQAAPTSSAAAAAGPTHRAAGAIKRPATTANDLQGALAARSTPARTMGKVYFRFGAKEYWCSASAVSARNRSVVATAGHCAFDARQTKAPEYWIFVPNPGVNGEAPDGIYVGASVSMHEDWPGKGDYDYDYAFVTVHRGFTWVSKNGGYVMADVGRLQDNIGGQGLELNKRPSTYTVASFGYPAGAQPDGTRPYDGRTLQMCPIGPTRWTVAPSRGLQKGVLLQPCAFSPGASGGPWLTGYDKNRGLGKLTGVNSLTWNTDAKGGYDAVSSPYFDTATGDVYRDAAGRSTPGSVT